MKIYLATTGTYSDYHVITAFSKISLAREFQKYVNCEIEQFEINKEDLKEVAGMEYWEVVMKRNGDSYKTNQIKYSLSGRETVDPGTKYYLYNTSNLDYNPPVMMLNVKCWAKGYEHARKIANEIRARLIAENEWAAPKKKPRIRITKKIRDHVAELDRLWQLKTDLREARLV